MRIRISDGVLLVLAIIPLVNLAVLWIMMWKQRATDEKLAELRKIIDDRAKLFYEMERAMKKASD
ncbi:MAG: hypothetical protein A2W35_06525 [Chloroflexi bacterium RBG_16_57_11]|nr:MAG: hypothetical protein A2W35_06525 [Chloroflexi bacterium RBG_16_57_11]